MERNRNESMDGGVNGLTAGVVLETHGNITDKQAGSPGPFTQCEPQTRRVYTNTQEHTRGQSGVTGATQQNGEYTSWLARDISAWWLLTWLS